jgi:hypothetical protein
MSDLTEIFGEPISVYTRAQALEDGALVDLSEHARDFGIRWPVACTRAVWVDCIEWSDSLNKLKGTGQDEIGRACDVLAMAAWRLRKGGNDSRGVFTVLRTPTDGRGHKPRPVELHIHCGPGDTPAPVLTIMMPTED